jgi:hypothetical protein
MALSDELRSLLADPRQTTMLRERAERVFAKPITLFTEADVLAAWAPLMTRELARELLDALAFAERLDPEELALVGELALVAEDCYRAWSADLDTDGAEWRQITWSYTERRGHRSMVLHVSRWDGQVVRVRTSPEGLGRLIQRLAEAQREWASNGGAIDGDAIQHARELLDEAADVDAGRGEET